MMSILGPEGIRLFFFYLSDEKAIVLQGFPKLLCIGKLCGIGESILSHESEDGSHSQDLCS